MKMSDFAGKGGCEKLAGAMMQPGKSNKSTRTRQNAADSGGSPAEAINYWCIHGEMLEYKFINVIQCFRFVSQPNLGGYSANSPSKSIHLGKQDSQGCQ